MAEHEPRNRVLLVYVAISGFARQNLLPGCRPALPEIGFYHYGGKVQKATKSQPMLNCRQGSRRRCLPSHPAVRGFIVRTPARRRFSMLPASDLTEILTNLSALNLQPNTAAVLAPLLRNSGPEEEEEPEPKPKPRRKRAGRPRGRPRRRTSPGLRKRASARSPRSGPIPTPR